MKKGLSGDKGELLAANYLESMGYEIIEKNFRFGRNEIDLIAHIDGLLIFVEVKFRSSIAHGYPEEMVPEAQEERIRDAAEHYIDKKDWKGNIRFDIVAIHSKNEMELFHIKDAF